MVDHPGRDDVGHHNARDRAKQAGRADRDLGRAAAVAAHNHDRQIVEELGAARGVEKLAEQHERDHDGGADLHREAEDAAVVDRQVQDPAVDADRPGLEGAGHQMADQRVQEKHAHDDHQGEPRRPAKPLDRQDDQHRPGDKRIAGHVDHAVGEVGKAHRDIGTGSKPARGRQRVVPRQPRPLSLAGRDVQVDQRQPDAQHRRQILLGEQRDADGAEEVSRPCRRRERQRRGQNRSQPAHDRGHRRRGHRRRGGRGLPRHRPQPRLGGGHSPTSR